MKREEILARFLYNSVLFACLFYIIHLLNQLVNLSVYHAPTP